MHIKITSLALVCIFATRAFGNFVSPMARVRNDQNKTNDNRCGGGVTGDLLNGTGQSVGTSIFPMARSS